MRTRDQYHEAFVAEQARRYPLIDAFEAGQGFAVPRARLETAALFLACPVKARPPNWQHGRVLYALTRAALADHTGPALCLDIGTAKGFSALCLRWALDDEAIPGCVISTDVIAPESTASRNSVAECNGPISLPDLLQPWPEASRVIWRHGTGVSLLAGITDRVHVAFIDGKHTEAAVSAELAALAVRQQPGDRVLVDDLQIPGVRRAVERAHGYSWAELPVTPDRIYALGGRQ